MIKISGRPVEIDKEALKRASNLISNEIASKLIKMYKRFNKNVLLSPKNLQNAFNTDKFKIVSKEISDELKSLKDKLDIEEIIAKNMLGKDIQKDLLLYEKKKELEQKYNQLSDREVGKTGISLRDKLINITVEPASIPYTLTGIFISGGGTDPIEKNIIIKLSKCLIGDIINNPEKLSKEIYFLLLHEGTHAIQFSKTLNKENIQNIENLVVSEKPLNEDSEMFKAIKDYMNRNNTTYEESVIGIVYNIFMEYLKNNPKKAVEIKSKGKNAQFKLLKDALKINEINSLLNSVSKEAREKIYNRCFLLLTYTHPGFDTSLIKNIKKPEIEKELLDYQKQALEQLKSGITMEKLQDSSREIMQSIEKKLNSIEQSSKSEAYEKYINQPIELEANLQAIVGEIEEMPDLIERFNDAENKSKFIINLIKSTQNYRGMATGNKTEEKAKIYQFCLQVIEPLLVNKKDIHTINLNEIAKNLPDNLKDLAINACIFAFNEIKSGKYENIRLNDLDYIIGDIINRSLNKVQGEEASFTEESMKKIYLAVYRMIMEKKKISWREV
jgi:hypothetical protein